MQFFNIKNVRRNKLKATFLVCTVQRGEQLIIPDGHFVLKEGDKIVITGGVTNGESGNTNLIKIEDI